MRIVPLSAATALAAIVAAGTSIAQSAGAPSNGQRLYEARCGGCHSIDATRVGPAHRNVVGRRIASLPGYAYSPAIKRLTGTWTPARLDQWLQSPQAMAPGSKMYLNVSNPAERRDIIAWLALNSRPAKPARR